MVETSHEQVEHAESEIADSLDALDEISDAVEEATRGIQEVADANDDQASAIENVTSMVEDALIHAQEADPASKVTVSHRPTGRRGHRTDRPGRRTHQHELRSAAGPSGGSPAAAVFQLMVHDRGNQSTEPLHESRGISYHLHWQLHQFQVVINDARRRRTRVSPACSTGESRDRNDEANKHPA